MAEIGCKKCTSPRCDGCNTFILETALRQGKFDALMNGNRTVHIAASVRENVKSKWEDVEITMITEDNAPSEIVSMFCPVCRRYHNEVYHYGNPIENANFCPRCGADMTGGNDG